MARLIRDGCSFGVRKLACGLLPPGVWILWMFLMKLPGTGAHGWKTQISRTMATAEHEHVHVLVDVVVIGSCPRPGVWLMPALRAGGSLLPHLWRQGHQARRNYLIGRTYREGGTFVSLVSRTGLIARPHMLWDVLRQSRHGRGYSLRGPYGPFTRSTLRPARPHRRACVKRAQKRSRCGRRPLHRARPTQDRPASRRHQPLR